MRAMGVITALFLPWVPFSLSRMGYIVYNNTRSPATEGFHTDEHCAISLISIIEEGRGPANDDPLRKLPKLSEWGF